MNPILKCIGGYAMKKVTDAVLAPVDDMVSEQLSDISTAIGSFIIRNVRGKFQRSISFVVGNSYTERWMEDALYSILYQYNNITKDNSRLELSNAHNGGGDGSGMYYRLSDGTHTLKYRNYKVMLYIKTLESSSASGRLSKQKSYSIVTYDLDPKFVTQFENDMLACRNDLLKIKTDSPTLMTFLDHHESDGWTYWSKDKNLYKRRMKSVYIPIEQKRQIADAINSFVAKKDIYHANGIPWKMNILLEGPPGTGKDTIARMIASEWHRNIYFIRGGKKGNFVPDAITSSSPDIIQPLFLISDIDKFPFLINEEKIDMSKNKSVNEEQLANKQTFGRMINALDGVGGFDGAIVIMSTNHIENFSDTFTRPGRIDLQLHIGYVTTETLRYFVRDQYGKVLPKDIQLRDEKTTMAQLQFLTMTRGLGFTEFMKEIVK